MAGSPDKFFAAAIARAAGQEINVGSVAALSTLDRQGTLNRAFADGSRWVWTALGTPDGGTVVAASGGGVWRREYTGPVRVAWWGAVGDGVADDTAALTAALNASNWIQFEARTYRITAPLPDPTKKRLEGVPALDYIDWTNDFQKLLPTYHLKGTIIQRSGTGHGLWFSAPGGVVSGADFSGITFRFGGAYTTADALFPDGTNLMHSKFTFCRIENIDRVVRNNAGPFGAIHISGSKFFAVNTILEGILVDNVIVGNTFTSCGTCFYSRGGGGLNTYSGNRFEYGEVALKWYQSRADTITGNLFDAFEDCALDSADDLEPHAVSGNNFWRNGRAAGGRRAHIAVRNPVGIAFGANVYTRGVGDGETQALPVYDSATYAYGAGTEPYPRHVLSVTGGGTVNWAGNATRQGYTRTFINEPDGPSTVRFAATGVELTDQSHDRSVTSDLATLNRLAAGPVQVRATRSFVVRDYLPRLRNVTLIGAGSGVLTVSNDSGAMGLGGMVNVSYGGLAWQMRDGALAAALPPGQYGQNGGFDQGDVVRSTAADKMGWMLTNSGQPYIWESIGPRQAAAQADAAAAPTQAEFNALLAKLRAAGILAT